MIINKNSWHYKIVNSYSEGLVPNDICRYMSRLVGALITEAIEYFLFFLLGIFVFGLVACTITPLVAISNYYFHCFPDFWVFSFNNSNPLLTITFGLMATLGISIWSCLIIGVGLVGILKGFEKIASKQNILSIWWKSFRDKSCNLIEFEE